MSAMASQITSLTIVLLKRLFRHKWKKTSKLRVTGLCEGNSPVTGEFPAQRASNAENVSISWRHHVHVWCNGKCHSDNPTWDCYTGTLWLIIRATYSTIGGWNVHLLAPDFEVHCADMANITEEQHSYPRDTRRSGMLYYTLIVSSKGQNAYTWSSTITLCGLQTIIKLWAFSPEISAFVAKYTIEWEDLLPNVKYWTKNHEHFKT